MDEMSSDRRSAMAKCLAPEKCADFMSRMVPSCAAETMMHMGLAAAKEVYRRMTVEDRKRLSEQWDEEFRWDSQTVKSCRFEKIRNKHRACFGVVELIHGIEFDFRTKRPTLCLLRLIKCMHTFVSCYNL